MGRITADRLAQIARYLVVGLTSAAVDIGGLWLLHGVFGIPLPIAAAVSFLASFVVNFTLNQRWTFGAQTAHTPAQLVRFTILVVANTILTSAGVTGLASLGLNYLVGKVIVVAVLTVLNFLMLRLWVFQHRGSGDELSAAGEDTTADELVVGSAGEVELVRPIPLGSEAESPMPDGNRSATLLWVLLVPVTLALAYWWFEALVGFNPTDDGFVLAQSWRLLQGESIHVDFTSPRPLGSAFLHLPEVVSPWATMALSRFVVVAQQLWIAAATVSLIDRRRRMSPAQRFALMIVAFMVNTGVWPIMAWHTVDGVFLGITALWMARRISVGRADGPETRPVSGWKAHLMTATAWLLAGAAPLVKQGFLVVPLLVALIFVADRRLRSLLWAPLVALPWLAYVAAAGWQLGVIQDQLYGGSSGEITKPLSQLLTVMAEPVGIGTVVIAAFACWMAWSARQRPIAKSVAAVLVMSPAVLVGASVSFGMADAVWPFLAVLPLLVVAVWMIGRWPEVAVVVALLGLAFAASASWGVPTPGLIAGSMVAAAGGLLLIGRDPDFDVAGRIGHSRFGTAILLVFAIVSTAAVVQARSDNVYREGPQAQLTARSALPALAGIRMLPQSAGFTATLQDCVDRAGVSTVAVIPGGAGLYPLMRVTSPFDIDWWLSGEYPPDIRDRTLEDVSRLNGEPGWLVLYQTYDLSALGKLPLAQVDLPSEAGAPVGEEVAQWFEGLDGEPVTCGSLVGEYRPGQPSGLS